MNCNIPFSARNMNKMNLFETINEYEKYYLLKGHNIYKINVGKQNNSVIIKCKRYEIILNNNEFSILTNIKFNAIDQTYQFIINLFECNKVKIKKIKNNDYIKLKSKIYNFNQEKEIEIKLQYSNLNDKSFINKLVSNYNNSFKIEIKKIQEEIISLKKEIGNIKKNYNNNNSIDNQNNFNINNNIHKNNNNIINNYKNINNNININENNNNKNINNNININENNNNNNLNNNNINNNIRNNNNIEFNSDCNDIKFLNNIVSDSFCNLWLNDTFISFKSINNIHFLIYSNNYKSIISFDIINKRIINEIKKAHEEYITNFRYYFDLINKRDLILSISSDNNNLKLWNINPNNNNFECLLDIKKINKEGFLDSACFLKDNNQIFILTSNHYDKKENLESIKLYDFKGNKIKEINDSNDDTKFINTYYDNKLSKNYIFTGTNNYSKSYDFNENKIYHKYYNDEGFEKINSIIINKRNEIVELIESTNEGYIRIWNFHSGLLLKKIKICHDQSLREICLWDNNYLFVGCDDKTIKLIDYNNGIIIKELTGHNDKVISIKSIIVPQYGKCLLSKAAYDDGSIKLWICKK